MLKIFREKKRNSLSTVTNKFISVSTFAKYAGINPSLMRQYKQRIAFASEAQKAKIEQAIHKAGKELISVQL